MSRLRRPLGFVAFLLAGPLLVALAQVVPFLSGTNLVFLGFTALAAVGLTLIMGFAGQVSIGHAAFYGIGAYSLALLTVRQDWPPVLALLAGLVIAGALAAVLGAMVLRIRGHFLAMATLAFGLIVFFVLRGSGFTGGNSGLGGIPGLSLLGVDVEGDAATFLVTWAILALGIVVAQNIVDSRTGRALRAMGASEVAAAASGIDVRRTKIAVFAVGSLYAALAGSLYAMYVTYIAPDAFGVLTSIELLIIATIGGLRSVWGAPLGALFVILLTEGSREVVPLVFSGATGSYELVAYGLALILVLLVLPQGLAGGIADLVARARGARAARAERREPAEATGRVGERERVAR